MPVYKDKCSKHVQRVTVVVVVDAMSRDSNAYACSTKYLSYSSDQAISLLPIAYIVANCNCLLSKQLLHRGCKLIVSAQ
jgi:hypothetical protein